MGVRSRIAQTVLNWAVRKTTLADYLKEHVGDAGVYSARKEWSVYNAIKEGYKAHPVVFRAMNLRASTVGSVPWQVKTMGRDGPEIVEKHSAVDFQKRPHPRIGWDQLIRRVIIFCILGGDHCWHINSVGKPIRTVWVHPLLPHLLEIKLSDEGEFVYEYTAKGKLEPRKFKQDEVVHFQYFDPLSDVHGMGQIEPAGRVIDTANAAFDWNKEAVVNNRLVPDVVIGIDPATSKESYTKVREKIDERSGKLKARAALLVPGLKSFQQGKLTPIEMDYNKSLSRADRQICIDLGVYPDLIGVEDATYENYEKARRALWTDTAIPDLIFIRNIINRQLAPQFDGEIWFDFDLTKTEAMVWARRENAEEAKHYIAMGIAPRVINERLNLGFNPDECPATGFLPATLLPVVVSKSGGRSVPSRARRASMEFYDNYRSINLQTDAQFAAHWRTVDRQEQAFTNGITAKVRERFDEERKAVVKAIKEGRRDLDPVIDSQADAWSKLLTAACRAVIEHFGEQTAKDLSGGEAAIYPGEHRYVFDPWNALIQGFVATKVAKDVQHVTDTTKKTIRTAVAEGLNANEGSVQIAKRVEGIYSAKWMGEWGYIPAPSECKYRCAVIARTEVHSAAGFAMHESARQSGVVEEKHWYDSSDERVRDSHIAATAQGWIPFDQVYSNGCMYPGDGPAEEVLLCRCVEAFRTRRR